MSQLSPLSWCLMILLHVAAVICLGLAILYAWIQICFSYRPQDVAKTGAVLQNADHQKNVTIRGLRGRKMFVKDLTKAVYAYRVQERVFYIRETFVLTTKRQTPKFVPVVYNKRFPRFAYMDICASLSDIQYGIRAAILGLLGSALAWGTVTLWIK